MSLVETIRQWDEGVVAADKKDWPAAFQIFCEIQEPNSKIYFNIGCLCLINGDLNATEKAFDNSIYKDEHLAVAFFQRGITFYKKQKYEEALRDFQKTFHELRGNQLIDYKLLGLWYKLYACEVLHNVALAHAQLNEWEKAEENLLKALNLKTEVKHSHIDRALGSILKQKLFDLVELPMGELFRPNKHHVAQLEKKDYLGKAKVLASVIHQDVFSGFTPLQPQVQSAPLRPKTPEILRVLEGEPHRICYEFFSETANELSLLPGNIVFVLQKGADNWATVIFNGKKGLVPYNYLEPVELTLSSKKGQETNQSEDLPKPPKDEPPERPAVLDTSMLNAKDTEESSAKEGEQEELKTCIIKVHFTYTVTIQVEAGLSYSDLLEQVCKKLQHSPRGIILRYKKNSSSEKVCLDDSEMEIAWSQAKKGHLTLWCELTENKESLPKEDLTQLVALHCYKATQPEDLEFQTGDIITLLSKVNEEWFEGQCKGNVGIFPAAFVEEYINEDRII
ncbi:neutrophil cytosol factor 2-like [Acipenser oxyrinchus oxyrinchus]|uniref:Neutrophil cytosol factor 2-like n=1 Tax=Acipenser oxyrinchus oxyrinchus TaxID=40147 RepID=A0AAD8G626_ACIOX|nr:neutrophil cytosol factor 2-like [Acipenser oxyrinchus oxyrinchus]